MAVGANSYGTVSQVAALTKRYTAGGVYNSFSTNPSLAAVEDFIDQVSAILNVCLAGAGFHIPITQADALDACASVVIPAVVDLCHAANSTGRFYTDRALERGISPLRAIRNEIAQWVEEQAPGLELLGATRERASSAGILTRGTNNAGDDTFPIFQRDAFSKTFKDYDPP